MAVTDQQVRMLMRENARRGNVSVASVKAGMSRQTGGKYIKAGTMPSAMKGERHWRTHEDVFAGDWEEICGMLVQAPELQAGTIFEWLCERNPDAYEPGQLRTLQRRVREWRGLNGPAKEVFFPQDHHPGRRMSTDFTDMGCVGITIGGSAYVHKICHCVLTYSNWEWVSICLSESMLAIRKGVQDALFQLGAIPQEHWTDHSSAATHEPSAEADNGRRVFNKRYLDFMSHVGMTPRTIQVQAPHENGDVESLHGAFRERLKQHLLLRGSRDFESIATYELCLQAVATRANGLRHKALEEELKVMRELRVDRLPEYDVTQARVRCWSTVRVSRNSYSVPSRLIGQIVTVKEYMDHVDVFYCGVLQASAPRQTGRGGHSINYRHIIDWLIRKPGAFRNYRYNDNLYPTLNFRKTYDRLTECCSERVADIEYLRILKHAAHTMESTVDEVLCKLLQEGITPRWEAVICACPVPKVCIPEVTLEPVDLGVYDTMLLRGVA